MSSMTIEDLFKAIKEVVKNTGMCPPVFDVSIEDFEALCRDGELDKVNSFIASTPFGLIKIRAY